MVNQLKIVTLLSICLYGLNTFSQNSIQEKLGFEKDAKLLIIHADDLGVSHSENRASILAMKIGMVNSASIMMPTPWVSEIADYAKENPDHDLGLHQTLTSEWKHIKWGPIASKNEVPSLLDDLGHFYDNCLDFGKNAKVEEAEKELRAQIEKSIKMGINPTHFDTHMGCLLFNSPEIFEVYLKLGREYKVPVMVPRLFLQAASQEFKDKIKPTDYIVDKTISAGPPDYENGMAEFYANELRNLSEGVHVMIIHTAFNDAEMQALSFEHPMWGAEWRQQDFDFFTSDECRKILKEKNIKLIQWKDIGEVMYGKN